MSDIIVAWRNILQRFILIASVCDFVVNMSMRHLSFSRSSCGRHPVVCFICPFMDRKKSRMDVNHSPSMWCSGFVSSRTGDCIPAMSCTQSRLICIDLPRGDCSLVCWVRAFICSIDCSTYRFLMPTPPIRAGPYITALAVFLLYPIFGRNLVKALFSIFVSDSSLRYVATRGYATAGMYIEFHAMVACDRVTVDAAMLADILLLFSVMLSNCSV